MALIVSNIYGKLVKCSYYPANKTDTDTDFVSCFVSLFVCLVSLGKSML